MRPYEISFLPLRGKFFCLSAAALGVGMAVSAAGVFDPLPVRPAWCLTDIKRIFKKEETCAIINKNAGQGVMQKG